MNSFTKTVGAVAVSLTLTLGVQASQAAEKVGYVNSQLVFQQMAKNARLETVIQKAFKSRFDELDSLKKSAQSKAAKYRKDGQLMGVEEKVKLRREIEWLEAQIAYKDKILKEDISRREKAESKKIGDKLKNAVFSVAEKAGYDLVIDSASVLYAKPQDDISKQVLKAVK